MAVVTPLHPICELDSRTSGGLEVTLLWNRRSNELTVCVRDCHTGSYFELRAERNNALDVFHHPYAYAAARGTKADLARTPAAEPHQPLPSAA